MLSGRDCNGNCTVRDMPDREEETCQKKIRLMKSDNSVKRSCRRCRSFRFKKFFNFKSVGESEGIEG